ncbi:MAG TPA: chemotaxis protein CheW [Acetobacteraceae bacterium]|nr:chemotaxis protein CheW [Acetobacteraceae bacterium]
MTHATDHPLVVLILELQGESFAIETSQVREILDPVPVTAVPGADRAVDGLINVRGRVVPLADLRLLFNMPPEQAGRDARIVVIDVSLDGDPTTIGIRADKVNEVTELAAASLEATPRIGLRWEPDFITCIGKRNDDFVAVLDMGRIFSRLVQRTRPGGAVPVAEAA